MPLWRHSKKLNRYLEDRQLRHSIHGAGNTVVNEISYPRTCFLFGSTQGDVLFFWARATVENMISPLIYVDARLLGSPGMNRFE